MNTKTRKTLNDILSSSTYDIIVDGGCNLSAAKIAAEEIELIKNEIKINYEESNPQWVITVDDGDGYRDCILVNSVESETDALRQAMGDCSYDELNCVWHQMGLQVGDLTKQDMAELGLDCGFQL